MTIIEFLILLAAIIIAIGLWMGLRKHKGWTRTMGTILFTLIAVWMLVALVTSLIASTTGFHSPALWPFFAPLAGLALVAGFTYEVGDFRNETKRVIGYVVAAAFGLFFVAILAVHIIVVVKTVQQANASDTPSTSATTWSSLAGNTGSTKFACAQKHVGITPAFVQIYKDLESQGVHFTTIIVVGENITDSTARSDATKLGATNITVHTPVTRFKAIKVFSWSSDCAQQTITGPNEFVSLGIPDGIPANLSNMKFSSSMGVLEMGPWTKVK
jgi:hypothetical protein